MNDKVFREIACQSEFFDVQTPKPNPDFVKLAESFGAKGVRVKRAGEFEPLLRKALEDGGIWIFDVEVDYSENMNLLRS